MDAKATRDFGLPTLVLMENAGYQCAATLLRRDPQPGRVVLLAGKGNNGGDAMVMARHLDAAGVDVRLVTWWSSAEMSPDAGTNAEILHRSAIDTIQLPHDATLAEIREPLAGAVWIVDGLLGIGASGAPRSPISTALECVASLDASRFCIDWPTGVSCETGEPCDEFAFQADLTCTLVGKKLNQDIAKSYCGEVVVGDIGVPRALLKQFATHS
jgi:NAD(P)H-hydrate epimerase